jgi:hypothetical protein
MLKKIKDRNFHIRTDHRNSVSSWHTDQTECHTCPIRSMITDNHIRSWRSCEVDGIEHNSRYGYSERSAKLEPRDDPIGMKLYISSSKTKYLGHRGKQSSCHTLFVRQGELGNE